MGNWVQFINGSLNLELKSHPLISELFISKNWQYFVLVNGIYSFKTILNWIWIVESIGWNEEIDRPIKVYLTKYFTRSLRSSRRERLVSFIHHFELNWNEKSRTFCRIICKRSIEFSHKTNWSVDSGRYRLISIRVLFTCLSPTILIIHVPSTKKWTF